MLTGAGQRGKRSQRELRVRRVRPLGGVEREAGEDASLAPGRIFAAEVAGERLRMAEVDPWWLQGFEPRIACRSACRSPQIACRHMTRKKWWFKVRDEKERDHKFQGDIGPKLDHTKPVRTHMT